MSDDDLDPQEVDRLVSAAVGELLNLAAGVAELQTTDEAAEDIYAICDLVAEYHGIERAVVVTTENDDGSFTTHFENPRGETQQPAAAANRPFIPGSIRTGGKPKLRVIDKDTPLDLDDEDDDE